MRKELRQIVDWYNDVSFEKKELREILHAYIDVSPYEDYTDYDELVNALIEWHSKYK